MVPTNLDMDVLRTLVVATDLGGFVRAANRLGRSQSAVSLQMRKLEDQVGKPLFRKQGRGVGLTDRGDILLGFARRILELNDEAVSAARGLAMEGTVRMGLPHDLADGWLSGVLGRFSQDHPQIHVEVQVGRGQDLREQVSHGLLDLAVLFETADSGATPAQVLCRLPMTWIGRRPPEADTVSLALLEAPCIFRQAAIDALDKAHRPWRLAFTSPSLAGLWAALEAGMGIAARSPLGIPPELRSLPLHRSLPPLPAVDLSLYVAAGRAAQHLDKLRHILIDALSSIPTTPIAIRL